jgi:hypothetical protein
MAPRGSERAPGRLPAQGTRDEAPETVDWKGEPIDCAQCKHAEKRDRYPCELGHACVQDRYALRVDRFFRWNPEVADEWLNHPYFEVRAIAARRASVFRLAVLTSDVDETVRASVALRLPLRLVAQMAKDPHREVRIRIAQRLPPQLLVSLCDDEDYGVRTWVARRLPLKWLSRLVHDPDPQVRLEVAHRLEPASLGQLADDESLVVRRAVAERATTALLARLAKDEAWEVRWEVAHRAGEALASQLTADVEEEVRIASRLRLAALRRRGPPEGTQQ